MPPLGIPTVTEESAARQLPAGPRQAHRAVFHVDGKGVAKHLDAIREQPDIQAIQWVQGMGTDWPIPLLERVLAAGKSVIVDVPAEELDAFIARGCVPVSRRPRRR